MKKHLEGIRVIDLTAYLAGPFVTLNLAALGADVIKIERPQIGDACRWNPPFTGPDGVSFSMKNDVDLSILYLKRNRQKRSMFLNLQKEKGKEILKSLISVGDVLVENFSPGVMERLGFDYARVKEMNPRMVYCSIAGYGQTGPFRDRTAFDLTIQATSGIMGITGFPDGAPVRCGAWIGDMIPALYATMGILSALLSRERTGSGERIDIGMQDACFSLTTDEALDVNISMGISTRMGNRLARLAPWNAYEARDGYIVICVANNTQWHAFLDAIGREDLKDDSRFKDQQGRYKNSDDVEEVVQAWLKNHTREEALKRLREKKVPCDEIAEFRDVLESPQLQARGMIQEVLHPVSGKTGLKVAGFPVKFTEMEAGISESAPFPGQHTEEILTQLLGMAKGEIEAMKEEEVI
jgi:crotonobetainyl-CoA:carnitine CoA-transferase CaiB-like acyl-CoA transferase